MEKFRGGAKSFLLTKHSVRYTIVNNKCIPDERMITYGKDSLVECRMGDHEYPRKFPEATITQIVAELNKKKFWDKHTVIIMLLSRMEKKGAVEYHRNGRAKEYYSIISQKETVLEETEQFLDRVYEGSLSLLVNSFLSSKKVSRDELDDLYEILQKAEREGDK